MTWDVHMCACVPTCRVGEIVRPPSPPRPLTPPAASSQDKETIREYAKASFDREMEEGRICYKGCAARARARARARAMHAHMHACARAARATSALPALHCLHCTACTALRVACAQVELGRGVHRGDDAHLPRRRDAHVESVAAPPPAYRRRHRHHAAATATAPLPPPPSLTCREGATRQPHARSAAPCAASRPQRRPLRSLTPCSRLWAGLSGSG